MLALFSRWNNEFQSHSVLIVLKTETKIQVCSVLSSYNENRCTKQQYTNSLAGTQMAHTNTVYSTPHIQGLLH